MNQFFNLWMLPVLAIASLLLADGAQAQQTKGTNANILWDGGFETGYGNGFWGVTWGNIGPNYREMWKDGVVRLNTPVATRVYWLDDGAYSLTAWVKRVPGSVEGDAPQDDDVKLTLTNFNYYRDPSKQEYEKKFNVPAGDQWHRVTFNIQIAQPDRRYFHVELSQNPNILVNAVVLSRGEQAPAAFVPAQPIEAGFYIPEETNTYIDGEPRKVYLMVHNHTDQARNASVNWQIYNHREELVRKDTVKQSFPANKTTRIAIPMDDLPYDGYRLQTTVGEGGVIGDALVAILPRIPEKQIPEWGVDANVKPPMVEFTSRFMSRLGMTLANTNSPGSRHGRWKLVNPAPGVFNFIDETVDVPAAHGIEIIGWLGLNYVPDWVKEKAMKGKNITDPDFLINAYCDYVEAYVRHFGGRVKTIFFEDEVHAKPIAKDWNVFLRCYTKAHERAHRVAKEMGVTLHAGFNATPPAFWQHVFDTMPKNDIDMVASNTVAHPASAIEILNLTRNAKVYIPKFYTCGVGQKSPLRKTSLISARPTTGNPAGLFAWQALMHFYQSRPYGIEDLTAGPMISYGYYDMRLMGQTLYLPIAGYTGVEYDNSPTLGMQAITMLKYQILGMRPIRDYKKPYTLQGHPTATKGLEAYAFRNDQHATIVLVTQDGSSLSESWELSGVDLSKLDLRDMYAQPIHQEGSKWVIHELPVYIHTAVDKVDEVLQTLRSLKAQVLPAPEKFEIALGGFTLQVDPDMDGYIRLSRTDKSGSVTIINRLQLVPAMPRPTVTATSNALTASAQLDFGKETMLTINMSEQGVTFNWQEASLIKTPVERLVRFRVGQTAAGEHLVLTEGNQVTTGRLREDFDTLHDKKVVTSKTGVDPDGASLIIDHFASFEMPPATIKNDVTPVTGFRWTRDEGEAALAAKYRLGPYQGGGSRGRVIIKLNLRIK